MNTQLPRCSLDRPHPVCVLPSDLLEQFHLRSPVHRPPCRLRRQSSQLVSEGGPNVTSTSGPNQNSEIRQQGMGRRGMRNPHSASCWQSSRAPGAKCRCTCWHLVPRWLQSAGCWVVSSSKSLSMSCVLFFASVDDSLVFAVVTLRNNPLM